MTLHVYDQIDQAAEPEIWRTIPGFSNDYEVSNLGRVRSYRAHGGKRRNETPHPRKTRLTKAGYVRVGLQMPGGKQKSFTVHSLVAAAFLGPRPDGHQVAHGDGDRTNARLDNLRYATPVGNAQDKHLHGTVARGETDGNSKVTEAQVREIRTRYSAGELQICLAGSFGISQSQVSNIVRGASWAHLDEAEVA